MIISEQNFRIVLDTVWNMFVKSVNMINVLDSIGLDINMNKESATNVSKCTGMYQLYSIQDLAAVTLIKLVGIDSNLSSSDKQKTVLEEFDQFFYDLQTQFYDSDCFPEEAYPELLKILTASGSVKLPWIKDQNGHSIGGAYWNETLFGKWDEQKTLGMLQDEGLAHYEVKLSRKGSITIWAHSEKEAHAISNCLKDNEIEAYVTFDAASVTDVYEI